MGICDLSVIGCGVEQALKYKKQRTLGKTVLIIDASCDLFCKSWFDALLGVTWDLGARLYPGYDVIIRGTSWAQVAEELAGITDILQVQFWGHGLSGKALIGKDVLCAASL